MRALNELELPVLVVGAGLAGLAAAATAARAGARVIILESAHRSPSPAPRACFSLATGWARKAGSPTARWPAGNRPDSKPRRRLLATPALASPRHPKDPERIPPQVPSVQLPARGSRSGITCPCPDGPAGQLSWMVGVCSPRQPGHRPVGRYSVDLEVIQDLAAPAGPEDDRAGRVCSPHIHTMGRDGNPDELRPGEFLVPGFPRRDQPPQPAYAATHPDSLLQ